MNKNGEYFAIHIPNLQYQNFGEILHSVEVGKVVSTLDQGSTSQ